MNAVELIECQADLTYRLTQSLGARAASVEGEAPLYDYLAGVATKELNGDQVQGPALAALLATTVGWARAYRVQENMTPVILERGKTMQSTDRIGEGSLRPPRPYGLVRLEEPLIFDEVRGRKQVIYWISWASMAMAGELGLYLPTHGRDAWAIAVWGDVEDGPDEVIRSIWDHPANKGASPAHAERRHRELFGRWAPVSVGYLVGGSPVGDEWITDPERMRKVRDRISKEGWVFDGAIHNPMRWLVALWELLGETMPAADVEHASEYVPRSTVKRARNGGIVEPAVTTVVLRRQSRPTVNPGSGSPMTSRIWIEGYNAWRWVGPRNDRRKVRRKVTGHWSNLDESLPTRERKIVSELRR